MNAEKGLCEMFSVRPQILCVCEKVSSFVAKPGAGDTSIFSR